MWIQLLGVGLYYFLKRNVWNFLVIFAMLGIAGLAVWQSALDNGGVNALWTSGFWLNIASELLGGVLTFALFEILISANNRQEELLRELPLKRRKAPCFSDGDIRRKRLQIWQFLAIIWKCESRYWNTHSPSDKVGVRA